MSATWHYGRLEGDHIVTMEPIEPHMDYHALYMAWYCRITRRFITSMDDFGLMGYQATSICPLIGLYHFNIMYILCIVFIPTISIYHFM